ncbi:aminodeoxychorismate lyase [Halomonas cupida]|uniref:aminodeoxychorismate lyase n=1 Tax=Halomonas TaxID=2745 RepID=UPI001A8E1B69|nr:aminodeoxychorismate lyase [Halomonas litopenaei]MBN8410851.1 aminodeoxychorismate lyase [Halomonas litopenaei]
MEEPVLPLSDRGLAYGDGLFETILVRDGRPLLWAEHVDRLLRGCRALSLPPPGSVELIDSLACCGPGLGVLKLVYTRGSGGRGYAPPPSVSPRLVSTWSSFTPDARRWHEGVQVRLCRLRLAAQPALAGIKHLARLENVLARNEWHDTEIAEGLMLDEHGAVVEATAMNVFLRASEEAPVVTPPLDRCGVAGTLRQALITAGAVSEAPLDVDQLQAGASLWVGNSVQGVWPVKQLSDSQGRQLSHWTVTPSGSCQFQQQAHALLGY